MLVTCAVISYHRVVARYKHMYVCYIQSYTPVSRSSDMSKTDIPECPDL